MAQDGGDASLQIIIMLLVAFILGYLLRFFISQHKNGKLAAELSELQASNKRLRDQLDAQKKQLDEKEDTGPLKTEISVLKRTNDQLNKELADCRKRSELSPERTEANPPAQKLDVGAKMVAGAAVKQEGGPTDDLTKIEGIGKKIQEHLNNGGIRSFKALASASIPSIQGILDKAGPAYTMHDPGTWPEQAAMARDGKWDELSAWQSKLKGGRKRKKR